MINARVFTDDGNASVKFDAVDWFHGAKDHDIIRLAERGFGHSYESDRVAEDMADKVEGIKDLFAYLTALNKVKSDNDVGFECEVDGEQALKWLEDNRGDLHPKVIEAMAKSNISVVDCPIVP